MQFQRDERVERRRARRRQVRRRRMAAMLIVAGVGTLTAFSTTSLFGGRKSQVEAAPAIQLPGGGTTILPNRRVVAFYGSTTKGPLGTLGDGTPTQVGQRLDSVAGDFDFNERPVLPAFELIATTAQKAPGPDGLWRSRLSDADIERYLEAARQARAILILDIQPGRAQFMDEVRHWAKYLQEPDVSLALDPEWAMEPGQIPGAVFGHTDASTINEVSSYLDQIVQDNKLPQKLLIVHHFLPDMIRNKRAVVQRAGLAIVFNIDGFGTPQSKIGRYNDLTTDPEKPAFVYNGFKVFYTEDTDTRKLGPTNLMSPFDILDLEPTPDVVVYE